MKTFLESAISDDETQFPVQLFTSYWLRSTSSYSWYELSIWQTAFLFRVKVIQERIHKVQSSSEIEVVFLRILCGTWPADGTKLRSMFCNHMQMCLRDVYCFIAIVIYSTVCGNRNMQHAHFRLSFTLSPFFVQFPWRETLFINILPNTVISYLFNIRAPKLKRSKTLSMFNIAPHHRDLW